MVFRKKNLMKGKVKKEFRRGRSKQRAGRPVVEQGSRQREKAGPGRALGYIHGSPRPSRSVDGHFFSPQPARKRKRKRIESARARARTMAALRLAVRRFCDRALGRSAVLVLSYLRPLSLSLSLSSGVAARSDLGFAVLLFELGPKTLRNS